ncbi:hypothetical protein [Pseudonocardia sp. EC080610-09]|uniref:hypothetical protein n=1 Tax=Pseudonocardia sp. EC080610-09 TaxID=1688404 RepID=UPI0007613671|nr:hypothetical protein [Pseudonocardia sp. EC080610-09]
MLATGRLLRHELELIRRGGTGIPGWYLTTKLPLVAEDGAVLGVVRVSEDLGRRVADDPAMPALGRVVELVGSV